MTQKNTNNSNSVLLNIDTISKSITKEDVQVFADVIDKEIGDRKLTQEEIEQFQTLMNVDALEAKKWKNVADVLKYISIFAVAENNPEAMKKISEVILSIVGAFFPAVNIANGIITKTPDKVFSYLIKIGGLVSPEYLLYRGVSKIAAQKLDKAKLQAADDANTSQDAITLIIVCKNKLLASEMSKLVTTEDDLDDSTIVGTKDGTVHPIIWNEAAWGAYRDKLTENDKVLIVGKIKNTETLTSKQIRFDKFGVRYGWNKNVALIEADSKVLSKTKNYKEFLSAINELKVSEKLKKDKKFKFNWGTVGKVAIFPPLLIGDILHEDTAIREQQLLFGLYKLYIQDLSEFLNSN